MSPEPSRGPVLRPDRRTVAKGIVATAAGLALFLWGLSGGHGPVVMGPGFVMLLGGLIGLYGALVLVTVAWTRAGLELSKREWARWAPVLEPRRDEILDRLRAGEGARAVAVALREADGVPEDVTLRYIIRVGREVDQSQVG